MRVSILFLTFFLSSAHADTDAYIKLQLDSSEVFSGDTIVLDVESTGLLDPIDLSVIEQNAKVLRETTGTRIAVVGGKVQEIAIRRMDLLPTRTGVLVIGPLISGEVISNSVHIKVLDATRPDWTPLAEDAQIKTTLTPATAMVNQQVLFTIELFHRYPISGESFELPDLKKFSKKALIENRRTFAGENKEWFRTEWKTLIYPRQSGTLTIDPITWSGTLIKSNVERAAFRRSTQTIQLTVEPAPPDTHGWWLPSRAVTLTESWSSPPTELRAGDELERTITVTASDVLAGQIPTPDFPESRALKQVLINTIRQESVNDNTVLSSADFTYRVTAQSPIPVFLDTVRMRWWDTSERTHREAIVPARRINVGLPDRADVLSKLALEESRFSQFTHRLRSMNVFRLTSYLAAFAALMYLLWQLVPAIRYHLSTRRPVYRHLKALEHTAGNGDALQLYRLLRSTKSGELLRDTHYPLVAKLEHHLFSPETTQRTIDAAVLTSWLEPVVASARCSSRLTEKPAPQTLAPL